MFDRRELKREAREINRSACVSAYLFSLIYLLISFVLNFCSAYVSDDIVVYLNLNFPEIPVPSFLLHASYPTLLITFVSVLVWLLLSVLHGGYSLYSLGVRRGEQMPYTTLFDGFAFVGKLILLNLVMSIFIALWLMLFIIPGIIASYRYRFAVYNLCENPEIGVMEAIEMSKVQTAGFKGELFIMDLSFIGWGILTGFTAGILMIWLLPYMTQTLLGYFQQAKQIKQVGYFPPHEPPADAQVF